jgi:hypothetical protein
VSTAAPPETPLDERAPGDRRGRTVVIVIVVAMVGMWGYVLYLAIGPGRQPSPDRLEDPAFGRAAQAVCDAAHDDVAALPLASTAGSAEERAAIIDQANQRFETMLDEIEALRRPAGEDGEIVSEWIADWRTYLGDRAEFAAALRRDPEAQLLVTAKDRDQVTEYIDAFAADNHMAACATPTDVG